MLDPVEAINLMLERMDRFLDLFARLVAAVEQIAESKG